MHSDTQVGGRFKSYAAIIWVRSVASDPRLSLGINSDQVGFGCQALSYQLCLEVHT